MLNPQLRNSAPRTAKVAVLLNLFRTYGRMYALQRSQASHFLSFIVHFQIHQERTLHLLETLQLQVAIMDLAARVDIHNCLQKPLPDPTIKNTDSTTTAADYDALNNGSLWPNGTLLQVKTIGYVILPHRTETTRARDAVEKSPGFRPTTDEPPLASHDPDRRPSRMAILPSALETELSAAAALGLERRKDCPVVDVAEVEVRD